MGFSLSWAAVRGGTPAVVQEALSLQGTGATEEIPESELTAAQLPGGWYMVVSQHDTLEFTKDKTLERLSTLGEVVTCFVEEHVMCSFAAGWRSGHRVWSVYHDGAGRGGIYQLDIKGEPPSAFAEIRERLRSKQEAAGGKKAGVDYIFDVPVELARSATGYRHDQDIPELRGVRFDVLARTQPVPKQRSLGCPHRSVPSFGNVKTKVVIGVLAGLLLAVIALWASFSAAPEHNPRDLLYWGQAGGTKDWSSPAVQGDPRAQFFYGFALIRTNLQTMIDRIPQLSAIPIIGKRFFETISYSIDNRLSQEQLTEAYRWIKQSADQGFPPAKEAEKLFIGRIKVPKSGPANGSQPVHSETNSTPGAAGSCR